MLISTRESAPSCHDEEACSRVRHDCNHNIRNIHIHMNTYIFINHTRALPHNADHVIYNSLNVCYFNNHSLSIYHINRKICVHDHLAEKLLYTNNLFYYMKCMWKCFIFRQNN